MKADSLFRAELMAKENVAERMKLIISEMLCCALEEVHQPGLDSVETEMDKSFDGTASLGVKCSSPQSCGYAHPSKAIENRFE